MLKGTEGRRDKLNYIHIIYSGSISLTDLCNAAFLHQKFLLNLFHIYDLAGLITYYNCHKSRELIYKAQGCSMMDYWRRRINGLFLPC